MPPGNNTLKLLIVESGGSSRSLVDDWSPAARRDAPCPVTLTSLEIDGVILLPMMRDLSSV